MDDRTTFAITDDIRDRDGVTTTSHRRGPLSSTTSVNFTIDSLMSTVVGRRSTQSLHTTSQSVCTSSLLVESDVTSPAGARSVSPPFSGTSRHDIVNKFNDPSRMSTERVATGVGGFYGGELQSCLNLDAASTKQRASAVSALTDELTGGVQGSAAVQPTRNLSVIRQETTMETFEYCSSVSSK
jgi:hypothetical protein